MTTSSDTSGRQATTDGSNFRLTLWPGQPVPEPPVSTMTLVDHDGGWYRMERTRDSRTSLPPELYLRQFRDANVDDPESLADVAGLGGPMVPIIYNYVTEPPHRDMPYAGTSEEWYDHLTEWWTGRGHAAPDGLQERGHQPSRRGRTDGRALYSVHAAEIAYRVWLVQRLTDHVFAHARGEPVDAAWGTGTGLEPHRKFGPLVPPPGKAGPLAPAWVKQSPPGFAAWWRFCTVVEAAMRDFHVRAEVSFGDDDWDSGQPSPTVYSVAVLQLVNDLTLRATYRQCGNEACRRAFVRQLGRGDRYRMVGVVRYCSRACANEQTQRDYRRRKRVERQNGEQS